MTTTLAHLAAVVAGLAIVASTFTTASRKGLFPGLAAAVILGVVAALFITAARTFG
jgi:hypothetical protein